MEERKENESLTSHGAGWRGKRHRGDRNGNLNADPKFPQTVPNSSLANGCNSEWLCIPKKAQGRWVESRLSVSVSDSLLTAWLARMSPASLSTIWRCWWEDLLVESFCLMEQLSQICSTESPFQVRAQCSVLFSSFKDCPCIINFLTMQMVYLAMEINHNTIWPNQSRQESCARLYFRHAQILSDWVAFSTHNTVKRPDDDI